MSDVENWLIESRALLRGHFLLSSGLHSDQYVQCARLLQDGRRASELGRRLAQGAEADLVVSPAMGGLLIGHEVAKSLGVPFLFTERADGAMTLRRGFEIEPGRRVLIVEDVFTTGKSTREVIEVVSALGGAVVGAASIIDRGMDPGVLGVPARSLLKLSFKTYPSADCPLCKAGTPAVKPGSRPRPGGTP